MAWEKLFDATASESANVSIATAYTGDALRISYNADGTDETTLPTGVVIFIATNSSLYVNIAGQVFSEVIINNTAAGASVSGLVLSNAAFAGLTDISITGQSLLTTITWPSFTGTLAIIDLYGNALTAAAQDAIILKVWDNAISKASTGKTFNILNNDGTYSAQSAAYLAALMDDASFDWTVNGSSTGSITVINNIAELQTAAVNLTSNVQLGANIDAAVTASWNDGAGFVPIGTNVASFSGTLNGNGFVVDGLYIRRNVNGTALVGYLSGSGTIRNLGLTNVDISGTNGYNFAGICGYNQRGTIEQCFVTGNIYREDFRTGSICGDNRGIIRNCWATATITGGYSNYTAGGGIAAQNYSADSSAIITNCHYYNDTRQAIGTFSGNARQGAVYQLDRPTSQQGVISLTAAEFKVKSNFVDWDFSTIWRMGLLYPVLRKFMKKQNANRSIKYLYFGA